MEPDWKDLNAVRSWLDSRYPNSDNQTRSPFYQYLTDEIAEGRTLRELKGREEHLSKGDGGKFLKFNFTNSGGNTLYHYGTLRETIHQTIHPKKDYPQYKYLPPPDTDSDSSPEPKSLEKRGGAKKPQLKRKRSSKTPVSVPNKEKIRRRNAPMKDTTMDGELTQIPDERHSTLRPRRNGKVHKEV